MPNPPDHELYWISGGARVGVVRNCPAGQSPADCTTAFNAAVAALKAIYPED